MAKFIPAISSCPDRLMQEGEKRVAKRLETLLEDDCLCWFDIPVGSKRRYPDFIVLNPHRGLLILEVKDWRVANIRQVDKLGIEYLGHHGVIFSENPLEQARKCSYEVINKLKADPELRQKDSHYKGKICIPYGSGVVFPYITRNQLNQCIPIEIQQEILHPHLVICSDEMTETVNAEAFQNRLWAMITYPFSCRLTDAQIDRIRWHLFPEIRITSAQSDLFPSEEQSPRQTSSIPNMIKIMDYQQELLARSLGEGHRVIHGVAGSGKTLILLYRCIYLAQVVNRPILVLCFNISLAARLKSQIAERGLTDKVQVFHFHGWCMHQCNEYNVKIVQSESNYYERLVESVIQATKEGVIPQGQYGALLIDEGHDFEAPWLSLITKMVDPKSQILLFMYDDAQSIYKKSGSLDFSLASVGIQAQGRTSILKFNYRNTRQIIEFSYAFSEAYFDSKRGLETNTIIPEAAGSEGTPPELKRFCSLAKEVNHVIEWVKNQHRSGLKWREIAIICSHKGAGNYIGKALSTTDIPYVSLIKSCDKKLYDPTLDQVPILLLPSSKGLEFHSVVVMDSTHILNHDDSELSSEIKRLYVGFTRATQNLLVTWHEDNALSQRLELAQAVN